MKGIEIKYYLDNKDWTDGQFEDFPEQEITIIIHDLIDLIESKGIIPKGCFVAEIENVRIIN